MPAFRTTRIIGVLCAVAAALLVVPAQADAGRAHRPARVLPVVLHRAPTPQPSIGAPQPEQYPQAPITIRSLTRDSFGFVTVVWSVQNTAKDANDVFDVPTDWQDNAYQYTGAPVSGVTLTDETAKVRYQPLRVDPRGRCACNSYEDERGPSMDAGAIGYYFSTYKLPLNVKSVTFSLADYAPAKNIPISNAA